MEENSTDQIFVKPISQPKFQSHVIDYINRYVSAERKIVFDYNHYLMMGSIRMETGWFADHAVEKIRKMGYTVHRRSELSEAEWDLIRSDILAFDYNNATFGFNSPAPPPQQQQQQQVLPTALAPTYRWSDNYSQEEETRPITPTTTAAAAIITTSQPLDDDELSSFLVSVVLTTEEYGKRRQMLVELHNLLNFGKVHPIGSVLTGLAGPMSDVDVCFADAKGRNKKIVLQEVADLLASAEVEKNRTFCRLVNSFPDVQVPMLTFVHLTSGFQCDLYIDEHGLSIQNSKLIKFLLSTGFHPLSSPLVIFLRHWAHSYQLIGGKNGLKSYTLTLLVIVFLVRKNILPSIQLLQSLVPMKVVAVTSGDNAIPAQRQQRWNVNFCDHFETVKREMEQRRIGIVNGGGGCQNLLSLVLEFCDLMTILSSELIVCTVTGEFLPISNFEQISQSGGGGQKYRMPSSTTSPARFIPAETIRERLSSTNSNNKWIVQDPLELSSDLMVNCSGTIFTRFLLALKETSGRIRSNYGQNILKELFIPSFRFEPKRFEKLMEDEEQARNEQAKKQQKVINKVVEKKTQINVKQKAAPPKKAVVGDLEKPVTVVPPSSSSSLTMQMPTLSFIIHPEPEYISAFFRHVNWTPTFEHELELKLSRLWYMSFLSFFKDLFGPSLNVFEWTTSRISVGDKFSGFRGGPSSKTNQGEYESVSSDDDDADDDMNGGRQDENKDQTPIAMDTSSSSSASDEESKYRIIYDQIMIQRNLFQDRSIRFEFSLRRPSIQNLASGQLHALPPPKTETQTNGVSNSSSSSSSKGRQPYLSLAGQQGQNHGFNCEARFQLKEFKPMVTVSISEIPQLIPPSQTKVNGVSSPLSSDNFLFLLNDFAPTLETFVRDKFCQYTQQRFENWLLTSGRQALQKEKC